MRNRAINSRPSRNIETIAPSVQRAKRRLRLALPLPHALKPFIPVFVSAKERNPLPVAKQSLSSWAQPLDQRPLHATAVLSSTRPLLCYKAFLRRHPMACDPEVLRHVPLFALLDDEETAVLASQVESRSSPRASASTRSATPADRAYVDGVRPRARHHGRRRPSGSGRR